MSGLRTFANCLADVQQERLAPTLERYWNDPAYRDRCAQRTQRQRDRANAAIDAGMAKVWREGPDGWERVE